MLQPKPFESVQSVKRLSNHLPIGGEFKNVHLLKGRINDVDITPFKFLDSSTAKLFKVYLTCLSSFHSHFRRPPNCWDAAERLILSELIADIRFAQWRLDTGRLANRRFDLLSNPSMRVTAMFGFGYTTLNMLDDFIDYSKDEFGFLPTVFEIVENFIFLQLDDIEHIRNEAYNEAD